MTEHAPIPDTVPANLADLLARKSGEVGILPDVHFSDDYSSELTVLISMLVGRSSTKPDHKQFLVATHMFLVAISETFRRMLDRSVDERAPQGMVSLVSQAAAGLGIAQFVVDNLMVLHKRIFGMNNTSDVSDQFLASIGLDRDTYRDWLNGKTSINP
jgi:hypothetical protein